MNSVVWVVRIEDVLMKQAYQNMLKVLAQRNSPQRGQQIQEDSIMLRIKQFIVNH